MNIVALNQQGIRIVMRVEAVPYVVVDLIVDHVHAVGAEGIHAEKIVMDVAVLDVPVNIDQVVEIGQRAEVVVGLRRIYFPDQPVRFRLVAAQVADVAVDHVHARLVRSHSVLVQAGTHPNEGALKDGALGIGSLGGIIPGSDGGAPDVNVAPVGGEGDVVIGRQPVVALQAKLVDIPAEPGSVQHQGRPVLHLQVGAQMPNPRRDLGQRGIGQGGLDVAQHRRAWSGDVDAVGRSRPAKGRAEPGSAPAPRQHTEQHGTQRPSAPPRVNGVAMPEIEEPKEGWRILLVRTQDWHGCVPFRGSRSPLRAALPLDLVKMGLAAGIDRLFDSSNRFIC